ncbi:MAG: DMT family transporter, partial [Candidatus Neomarinimicrobiota bacterium]
CKTGRRKSVRPSDRSWLSPVYLFLYAFTFSLAYVSLDTGTGALILFGAVQITMVIANFFRGRRLSGQELAGMGTAFAGFIYLILPGVSAPPLAGFLLMSLSGVAWGLYTLRGQSSSNPLVDTGRNFMRSLTLVAVLVLFTFHRSAADSRGLLLAVLSGSLASGVGYTVWYFALRGLSTTTAAVSQLAVPVLAAAGGILFLGETLTLRLTLATLLILGGIAAVVTARNRPPAPADSTT